MARLQELYRGTIASQLKERFGYHSVMEVPRITKITLNMGVGEAIGDKKVMEFAVSDMEKIAGQKAIVNKAKNEKRKVCAVGTTVMRGLESAVSSEHMLNTFETE